MYLYLLYILIRYYTRYIRPLLYYTVPVYSISNIKLTHLSITRFIKEL